MCIDTCKVLNFNLGGVSQQGVQNKDWVDASVAGWIESETKSMEEAWGPATRRSALAFVHIPPLVSIYSKRNSGSLYWMMQGTTSRLCKALSLLKTIQV